jgi:DNA repair exonuclease SbcCD ATPase subunit
MSARLNVLGMVAELRAKLDFDGMADEDEEYLEGTIADLKELADGLVELEAQNTSLEQQLAEARAEIGRLKIRDNLLEQLMSQIGYYIGRDSGGLANLQDLIYAKDNLIEQMREALVAAKNDGKMQSAITYQLIIAALSAAERILK